MRRESFRTKQSRAFNGWTWTVKVAAKDSGLSDGTISISRVQGRKVARDSQYAQAWYQCGGDETYSCINVSPGDLVTITVCGAAGNKEGLATLLNATENIALGAITVSAPPDVVVVVDSVAWSLGFVSIDSASLANYDATFVYVSQQAGIRTDPISRNIISHPWTYSISSTLLQSRRPSNWHLRSSCSMLIITALHNTNLSEILRTSVPTFSVPVRGGKRLEGLLRERICCSAIPCPTYFYLPPCKHIYISV